MTRAELVAAIAARLHCNDGEAWRSGLDAAIHLRVPVGESLDAMVRRARRWDAAVRIAQGLVTSNVEDEMNQFARYSFKMADALLATEETK